MKKCPQCGTILEETKKKCYMCGAELQKTLFGDFGDTFDEQIGATVTNGQDNVFNNVANGANSITIIPNNNEPITPYKNILLLFRGTDNALFFSLLTLNA